LIHAYYKHPLPINEIHNASPPYFLKKAQALTAMLAPFSSSTKFFCVRSQKKWNVQEWCRVFYLDYRKSDCIGTDNNKINNLFQLSAIFRPRCRSPPFLRFDSTQNTKLKTEEYKMDNNYPVNADPRPKRRKDKDNPYTIYSIGKSRTVTDWR